MDTCSANEQTATHIYEISTMWETKPRTTPPMGPKEVMRPKTLQAI